MLAGAIDFTPMPHVMDYYTFGFAVDLIDNAIVTYSYPIESFSAG